MLLTQLIESNKLMSYSAEKSQLIIKKTKPKDLAALNELLKKPLFEIRELTVEEIVEIEKELGFEEY